MADSKAPHELTFDEFRELYQRSAGRKGFDDHQARVEAAERYWNDQPSGRRALRTIVVAKHWERYERQPSEKELYHLCYILEALNNGLEVASEVLHCHRWFDFSNRNRLVV